MVMMRQESEDTNLDSSLLSRGDTPLPVPSLKADSVNSDSAKSVRSNLFHNAECRWKKERIFLEI